MFKRRLNEPFGKAGVAIGVLALVFAMLGGAYAATGGNGKQTATASKAKKKNKKNKKNKKSNAPLNGKQKKEVKKISQTEAKKFATAGPAGAAGAAGPAGPVGPAGLPGAKGDKGDKGDTGGAGSNGTSATTAPYSGPECANGGVEVKSASPTAYVCNGEDGQTGFTEVLPPEQTETGTWGHNQPASGGAEVPISFNIPIEPAPTLVYVGPEEDKSNEGCPGIAAGGLPLAEPGKLCVYAGFALNATVSTGFMIVEPDPVNEPGMKGKTPGVGATGTILALSCSAACFADGAWAATAATN